MRPISRLVFSGLAVLLVSTVGAQAATLKPSGSVMINRGAGFEVVEAPIDCHPADRVMVNRGTAHIEYKDGTTLGLIPGQLYVVGTSGRREHDDRAAAYGHGPHGGAPVAEAGVGGLSTSGLIVGGVVVAGGAALIISKVSSGATVNISKVAQPSSP